MERGDAVWWRGVNKILAGRVVIDYGNGSCLVTRRGKCVIVGEKSIVKIEKKKQ